MVVQKYKIDVILEFILLKPFLQIIYVDGLPD